MLLQYRHKINNLLKSKSKNSDNCKRKVQLLRDSAHKNLFDISACKCLDFKRCTCKLKNRVLLAECDFLCDQRSDRRMVIAQLDKAATFLNKKETNADWKELNSSIIYLCVVKLPATPAKQ